MKWEGLMMRGLVWVTVVLAALWAGWWWIGSRGVEAAAEGWFAAEAAQGRDAGYDEIAVRGFPSRFDLTVTAPRLSDPASGYGWRAPFAQVFAMSWKPWHLIAALPGDQVISHPGGRVTLEATRLLGSLLMVPGPDLALSEAVIEGEGLALEGQIPWLRSAGRVVASIRAETGLSAGAAAGAAPDAARYRLGLSAAEIGLDPAAFGGTGAGARIAQAYLDAEIRLSAPLDRQAGVTRPRLTGFALRKASLLWGEMTLSAKGEMAPDAAGRAAGRIEIEVRGWRHLPPVLAELGVIAPGFAPTLLRGLEVMAAEGADPQVLVVALTAEAGQMALGPLPLGPAPDWRRGAGF